MGRIKEKLLVESGAHLTIEDMRIEFFEDAQVVIEPGGRLTMRNTTFTVGPCDAKMWLGVEVWGDPTSSQLPFSNQGYLYMINSTIEHAHIGALAANRGESTDSPTANYPSTLSDFGGIVRAYHSQFRNNERDVLLPNYVWYSGGNEQNNLSIFTNCDFVTDALLNHPEIAPMYHAELYRVRGVQFKNSSFRNTASFEDLTILDRGKGIFSDDATFKVVGNNEPFTGNEEGSFQTFYQLNVGIDANGGPNHPFTVSKMEFQLNRAGIYAKGTHRETITFNNFEVPETGTEYPSQSNEDNIGAYLINSSLFTVEENYFFSTSASTKNGGLVVNNSGFDDHENEVYRNSFANLAFGITVENNNQGTEDCEVGLQARCNEFENIDWHDIYLADGSTWRSYQGFHSAVENLTNNSFSYSTYNCTYPSRDVKVSTGYADITGFVYNCLNHEITKPDFDQDHTVCPQQYMDVVTSFPNTVFNYRAHCPSNFGNGGGIKFPLAESVQKQATAESNLQSAITVYEATVDGGSSEDILGILKNLHYEESSYLRNLLMSKHPLSKAVLMATVEEAAAFDPWHLTQVMVANSRLPSDVYAYLKDNQILSPFFMQFVDDAQTSGNTSLRELLQSEISFRSYEKSVAERAINRHYLHHADSLDAASWNAYVDSRDEDSYKLYRLGEMIDKGETTTAQNMLDSLAVSEDYGEWLQFQINLAATDTVTEADIATAWDFFYNKPATLGNAWGWLTAQGELDSIPPLPNLNTQRSFSLFTNDEEAKAERWLQAWPNPAKDHVVLTYPREANGIGMVQVFGSKGEFIREFSASDVGFEEINITGWSPGIYIAKLLVEGKTFETVKFNVIR